MTTGFDSLHGQAASLRDHVQAAELSIQFGEGKVAGASIWSLPSSVKV